MKTKTPHKIARQAIRPVLCLALLCQVAFFNAALPALAQKSDRKSLGHGVAKKSPKGQDNAVSGQRSAPAVTGTVNVSEVAVEQALAPAPSAPTSPKEIHAPLGTDSGGLLAPGGTPLRPEQLPNFAPAETGDAPQVPSPSFSTNFQALDDGLQFIPPDTHGAVGPNHVMSTLNDRIRFQTRTGTIINTITLNSFWASLQGTDPNPPATFDPKVLYDRFNDRWMFTCNANAQSALSATFMGVSQTGDPTGTWNLYRVPPAGAGANWADYPSIGFNRDWIVVQINLFTVSASGFVGPDIYVFNKANLYAGGSGAFTRFTGDNTGTALAVTGGTWTPMIDQDNTTGTLYFAQNWNSTSAILRISKLTGAVGSEVLTPGLTFPQAPNAWVNSHPLLGGGWAPQAGATQAVIFGSRISNNDARMQNFVYRNGTLWGAHTAILTTTPLAPGTTQSAANPSNHSGAQWWQLNPAIENNTFSAPLQFGRIEDPTANNCHNGSGATIAGCTQTGTFFAFPSIAVNKHNDVLIGYTRHSPTTWASAAYSFRYATDAANTMRDPLSFKDGEARYAKSGGGNIRWGDYSSSMVDPVNDRNFWTVQEYADSRINADATSRWATWWANIPVIAGPGDVVISEFRLRGPGGEDDEFVELYNKTDSAITVATTDGSAGWSLVASDGVARFTIPNGEVIPARGHYLGTNSDAYSLASYPAGNGTTATGNITYTTDIPDNAGIALFRTATAANFTLANRFDAAGSAAEANTLYKEGAGYPTLVTPGLNIDYAFYRDLASGTPLDTGDNFNDFLFIDTNGSCAYAVNCTSFDNTRRGRHLGAPGPENLSSPIVRNATIKSSLIDPAQSATAPPNRVRDFTSDAGNQSTFGTLSIRRRFTNNTAANVTRLRFRVVDITTFPVPAGTADLRARTSTTVVVTTSGGPVNVQGTTLEQSSVAPPAQPNGGGFNSTFSAGTITLATPLAPGNSINVRFLLGIQQTGTFRFFLNVEALP
ncbi:MAG: lamin tail domain-containing protein [Rubrivivax sp.]|nr:lamin tail domain-containing protein [Pyrinomonadaceae bacterium]